MIFLQYHRHCHRSSTEIRPRNNTSNYIVKMLNNFIKYLTFRLWVYQSNPLNKNHQILVLNTKHSVALVADHCAPSLRCNSCGMLFIILLDDWSLNVSYFCSLSIVLCNWTCRRYVFNLLFSGFNKYNATSYSITWKSHFLIVLNFYLSFF